MLTINHKEHLEPFFLGTNLHGHAHSNSQTVYENQKVANKGGRQRFQEEIRINVALTCSSNCLKQTKRRRIRHQPKGCRGDETNVKGLQTEADI